MTLDQATDLLPTDAKWSCSFGNPGEGGFVEYYRTANGTRWIVWNGVYDASAPFDWHCEQAS